MTLTNDACTHCSKAKSTSKEESASEIRLNIAADDTEVAPEYVQTKFKPDVLAEKALGLLADPSMLQAQIDAQNKALSRMGERDEVASDIAANTILDVISGR